MSTIQLALMEEVPSSHGWVFNWMTLLRSSGFLLGQQGPCMIESAFCLGAEWIIEQL